MSPPGRPRKPENRDLPPGVYRRARGGKPRFYDAGGKALGGDKTRAALEIAQREADPVALAIGTWRNASKHYREWMDSPQCQLAKKTRSNYGKALKTLDAVFGTTRLDEIRPVHLGAIRRELATKPTWAAHLITMVSIVWKHAHSFGLTDAPNPAREITKPARPPREVHVTDDMIRALAAHGDQVLRDWIALELVAGQRVSDTLVLRRDHIVDDELRPPNSKTKKPIRIQINGDLRAVIDELIQRPRKVSGPWLVQTNTGRQVTYDMIVRRWGEALRKAKEADPTLPHFQRRDLRAKSATDAPETAQARLGHTSDKMTQRHYLRVAPLAQGGVLPAGILVENSPEEPRHD